MEDVVVTTSASGNQLVRFIGPSNDPLSYFDTFTEGGKIIMSLHRSPVSARQDLLGFMSDDQHRISSRYRALYGIHHALQASKLLLSSREVQLERQLYRNMIGTYTPSSSSKTQDETTTHLLQGQYAAFREAHRVYKYAQSVCAEAYDVLQFKEKQRQSHQQQVLPPQFISGTNAPRASTATTTPSAPGGRIGAVDQSTMVNVVGKINQSMVPPTPTSTNVTAVADAKGLTPMIAESIGMSLRPNYITAWPPHRISKHFGLSNKDDVMGLSRDVGIAILHSITDYSKNGHFKDNVNRLKKDGTLHENFFTSKILCNKFFSISTVRWLIMFYLEIPGFDDNNLSVNTPPFEVKTKESDHPKVWKTTPDEMPKTPKSQTKKVSKKTPSTTKAVSPAVSGSEASSYSPPGAIPAGLARAVTATGNTDLAQTVTTTEDGYEKEKSLFDFTPPVPSYLKNTPDPVYTSDDFATVVAAAAAVAETGVLHLTPGSFAPV
jgi:hypothetical protein